MKQTEPSSFTILDEQATPERLTPGSAGLDVKSTIDVALNRGETKLIPLGIKINPDFIKTVPFPWYLALHIRSSLAKKGGLLANGVGVIDADYPDEIKMMLTNNSDELLTIKKYQRIGQIIIVPFFPVFTYDVGRTRTGGFGSTGE